MPDTQPTKQHITDNPDNANVRIGVLLVVTILIVAGIMFWQYSKSPGQSPVAPVVPELWPTDVPFPTEYQAEAVERYLDDDYLVVKEIRFVEDNEEYLSFEVMLADGSQLLLGPVPAFTAMYFITDEGTVSIMEDSYSVKQFLGTPPYLYRESPEEDGVYFVMDLQGQEFRIFLRNN